MHWEYFYVLICNISATRHEPSTVKMKKKGAGPPTRFLAQHSEKVSSYVSSDTYVCAMIIFVTADVTHF